MPPEIIFGRQNWWRSEMDTHEVFHPSTDVITLSRCFYDPGEVARDCSLSPNEKREILASWASDARSIKDHPAYRLIESGQIVPLDEILKALVRLDDESQVQTAHLWSDQKKDDESKPDEIDNDDPDDDPPPVPAGGFIPWRPRPPLTLEVAL